MDNQPPEPSVKQPTGLDYCRQAAEDFSKMPLPSYEERMAQFKRNNEKIRAMEEDSSRRGSKS